MSISSKTQPLLHCSSSMKRVPWTLSSRAPFVPSKVKASSVMFRIFGNNKRADPLGNNRNLSKIKKVHLLSGVPGAYGSTACLRACVGNACYFISPREAGRQPTRSHIPLFPPSFRLLEHHIKQGNFHGMSGAFTAWHFLSHSNAQPYSIVSAIPPTFRASKNKKAFTGCY